MELTELTDIDDSCLLALMTPWNASRIYAEMQMLWHRRLAHVSLQVLEIMPMITDAPGLTGKWNCDSCIKCKFVCKLFTPTTSRATEPLQLGHSDKCSPLETAIRGGH